MNPYTVDISVQKLYCCHFGVELIIGCCPLERREGGPLKRRRSPLKRKSDAMALVSDHDEFKTFTFHQAILKGTKYAKDVYQRVQRRS